jgi:glycosyltransferase involved in cell wall biosynthesis
LWQAAVQCCQEDPAFARDFRVHFTGGLDPGVADAVRSAGLADHLLVDGFVDHAEATRRMAQAPLLLFVVPEAADNRRIITGKIFEYLASRTRMLSIGPTDGDAADLLTEAGRASMLRYNDTAAMAEALRHAHRDWLDGGRKPLLEESGDFSRFSRKALTGRLAERLNALCDEAR